ncbi:MAG TPA: hypothetical protein VGN60_02855 [Devosia sp.]|jgi:hypothetical protein|nr:hypothetical protein [Devosia sp.]
MKDRYDGFSVGNNSSATHAFAITPNDETDLEEVTRAIFVGGAGNLTVVLKSGATVTFANIVAGGVILPLRATRVLTSSTATDLVGLV